MTRRSATVVALAFATAVVTSIEPFSGGGWPIVSAQTPERGASLDPHLFRYRRSLPEGPAGLVTIPLDAAVLAHSTGPSAGFADVRVMDQSGKQVPYRLEQLEESMAVDLPLQRSEPKARELAPSSNRNISVYRVNLPYANLPGGTLVLETSARVFSRMLTAGVERPPDRNHRDTWFQTHATGPWVHAPQDRPASAFSLALPTLRERELLIAVDEGDNDPLPLERARLLLPAYRLRLYHPGGRLQLLYGRDDLSVPRYDIALLGPDMMSAGARELHPAPAEAATDPAPDSLISPRVFWLGLIAAVVVLAGLTVRLIRTRATPS